MRATEGWTFAPHAAELARLHRAGCSSPPPGSIEEDVALAAIDEQRYADEAAKYAGRSRSRRRLRRHWSDRGAQLDGR